ncbi:MAG: lysophospholipid acyltransferase family protein [Desulfobacteraceae bacterium]|nr:lysophospholipid acyltransferase family protein [Desulfobacteraceae bacterium]
MKRHLKDELRMHLPEIAARLLRVLSRLVRTKIIGFDQVERFGKVNFAIWHGDEMAMLPRFGNINGVILISQSKDGEMLARGARLLGYHVVRGSSSRRAVGGMVALIKASAQGYRGILAVDGPQGPLHTCKPGVVRLSQKSGVPLLPVGAATTRRYVFKKTWSKSYLPLPFGRQVIFFGEPLFFGQDKDAKSLANYCKQVEQALHSANREAKTILRQADRQ